MFSKYWKKIISVVLVLALLVQVTPLAVRAEETLPVDLECDPQTGLSLLYEHLPFDAGMAGTAYLNTYLGNLHIRRTDLYLGGERMPVEIEFYHDPANDISNNPYGAGWSTSYNQLINFDSQTRRFAYKDANGTWIYFVKSNEENTGFDIWKEDVEYGVGKVGLKLYVPKAVSEQTYTAIRIVDGENNYFFDAYGRLLRIVNGANTITVTYISNTNRINYIQDPVGRKFCFGYTGTNLAAIYCKSAEGTTISNSLVRYSIVNGQMQTVTYSNGDVVFYGYDAAGNVVRIVNVDQCGYAFTYNSGSRTLVRAASMAAMNTTEEATGTVTLVAHPADNQTIIMDGSTQQRYTFDGCGRVTNCELLTANSETSAQGEGSTTYQCVYGFNLTYDYVEVEPEIYHNTVVSVQTYDADGVIEATPQDETGEESEEETEEPETDETDNYSYTTDNYGNILTETYTKGNLSQTTTYTYSADGNYLTSQTDENGNTVQYTYDLASGLLQLVTDANGNETEYTYNALRELQAVHMDVSGLTNGSGMDTSYTYTQGRLTGLTYGAFVYAFTYDIWGNILSVTMNGKSLVTYDYGEEAYKGQVSTMTYGNGQKVYYFYNALGQISTVGYNNQIRRFAYQYNSDGSLASVRDLAMGYITVYTETGFELRRTNGAVVYSYASDEEGNLTETINALTFQYSFDSDSNTTSVTNGNGTSLLSVSNAYDALNRLYNKTITSGYVTLSKSYTYRSGSNGTGNVVSSYRTGYLVRGRQTSLSFNYAYDGNGNITSVIQTVQSGPAYTLEDPMLPEYSRSVDAIDGGESTTSATYRTYYGYDEAGQLVEAIDGVTGITYRYSYDKSGNIMSMNAYEHDASGNEVLVASKTFTYTNGILSGYTDGSTSVICNSDNAGNLTSTYGGTHNKVLTWGEGRRLMGVRKNSTNYAEYAYNANGLRTQKTVVENGVSTTTQYIWGNNGLAAIIIGDTTVVPIYDNDGEAVGFFVEKTEEYTPAIPDVVTQNVYTYVKNLQGDVIRILDGDGNTVVSYTYDPWGVPTVTGDTDLAALNPCSYRGYDYDEETGYYYLQSRYYDPRIGRFINADAASMLGAGDTLIGYNLFVYCENSAIASEDAMGYGAIKAVGIQFAMTWGRMAIGFEILFSATNGRPYYFIFIGGGSKNLLKDAEKILTEKILSGVAKASKLTMSLLGKFSNFGLSVSALIVLGNRHASFPKHYTGWFTGISLSIKNIAVSGAIGSSGKARIGSLGLGISTSLLSANLSQTYYWEISKDSSFADLFGPLKPSLSNMVNWLALFSFLII